MYTKLFVSVYIIAYISPVYGIINCKTYTGDTGRCLVVNQCQALFAILNKQYKSAQELDILRRSQCGFDNYTPKVCCPQIRIPPVVNNKCFTPDGMEGKCVNPYACPRLSGLLQQPITNAVRTLVQNLRCLGTQTDTICCASSTTTTGNTRQPVELPVCTLNAYPPDPQSGCCGRDGDSSNRIIGGDESSIDQYPWLAMIEYQQGSLIKLLCGGALISGKYVLTAAHCVQGSVLNSGTPVNVRLGEYDTSNSGPDCVPADGGGEDCTPGAVSLPIERTIPHPQYDTSIERNDIALIRLRQTAKYTDFIRPICLPSFDVNSLSQVSLTAAGWGATENNRNSNIKLHVDLPIVSLEECASVYQQRFQRPLWRGQLCAGGEKGKDSCRGDSGGPLMYQNEGTYELVGVVSFGPKPCAQPNIPGVYTNVFQYIPWIQSQIKP